MNVKTAKRLRRETGYKPSEHRHPKMASEDKTCAVVHPDSKKAAYKAAKREARQ